MTATTALLANGVLQQCARWYHTRYHLQRLCTWYRARFHVLAYRGSGTRFTTICAKRASGCGVATTRTGFGCTWYRVRYHVLDSTTWYRLRYHATTVQLDMVSEGCDIDPNYSISNLPSICPQTHRAPSGSTEAPSVMSWLHGHSLHDRCERVIHRAATTTDRSVGSPTRRSSGRVEE